ncbi:signal peptidase I [Bacillus sp. ISL-35]|uniref:signal peptidase I n=1 Tax=Bacillus sp. ISL-35 TaxID=2819122 RepID=UPI001BE712C2|nr:signal peptidase I [Bacillus sp. ISL-35]MBT2678655.1 signal peptidase I [Bacillus sp. ISL-35]MBT2703647.1 signal peptidase I [Chryseobacterium sp. ISL-80]
MRIIMGEGDTMPSIAENSTNKTKIKKKFLGLVQYVIFLIVFYIIFSFGIGIVQVSGYSMEPSLKDGSYLLTNKLASHITKASYGDVVVVKENHQQFYIVKRVIGVPGDTISISGGKVYVNNLAIPELYAMGIPNDMDPIIVPEDHIFVMGDNRTPGESLDSRDPTVGPIPNTSVKGYPILSLFPFYKIAGPLDL